MQFKMRVNHDKSYILSDTQKCAIHDSKKQEEENGTEKIASIHVN